MGRISRRLALALGVAAALLPAWPAPSAAFELFGIEFFGSGDDEPESPDAQPYIVELNVAGGNDDLRDSLQSASSLYADREDVPVSTPAFLARARGDYARIVAALYTQGRYGGSATITVAGRAVEDLPPNADLPRPVPVTVNVDPGPVFRFGEIAIAGQPGPVPDDDTVPETPRELGLVPGRTARSGVVLDSEGAMVETWRELGHPKARVAERRSVANHPSRTLDVAMQVQSGPWAVFGPVSVTGTERMNPAFVARHTAIEPGTPFDPDDLEEAREQMRRLGVFQSARIVEADTVGPDGTLPLTLNVAERPLRVFGAGASYSTLDGAGLETYWEHRNLFGQAEKLRLEGRVGGIGGTDVAEFDYYTAATFTKPGILSPYTDLTAQIFAKQDDLEAYRERTLGARLGLVHRFTPDITGQIGGNFEASRITDALGTNTFLLASVPGQLSYDNTDNELNPTEGVRATLKAEPFHEFEFGNTGLISEAEASTYFGFGEDDRFVLAGRLGVGSIVGAPRDELPASRLFFAGGGGSIRGYAYRNVGPRLPNGDVVGGRSYVDGSLELRAGVTDNIGLVPFVDFGSAYESSVPDFSEDLKVGAGLGVRYNTGLGPLRFDVAVPVNPGRDDPSVAFYIGLGQAF